MRTNAVGMRTPLSERQPWELKARYLPPRLGSLSIIAEDIPSFASLDIVASYRWGIIEPYVKATNIFDQFYYTEPGYPWRGRYFEFGIRVDVLR